MIRRRPSRAGRSALTLLELIASMALTAVLVGLIATAVSGIMGTWKRDSGSLAERSDARVALDILAADLLAAVPPADGSEWLHRRPLDAAAGGFANTQLLLISSASLKPGAGDAFAISYRLANQDPLGGGRPRIALYRAARPAAETLESAAGQSDLYSGFWQSRDADSLEAAAFLCDRVLGFRVTLEFESPDGERFVADESATVRLASAFKFDPAPAKEIPPGSRLAAAEIELVAASEEVANLIAEGAEVGEKILRPACRAYTRRIEFLP